MSLSPEEIRMELRECEHLYAECLSEDVGTATLRFLWEKIRSLRHRLEEAEGACGGSGAS